MRNDPGRSWSLAGPSAEAATCGAEETLQRRTRRTHCGRPCDSLGAMGYYHPRSRFGFVSVVWVVGHRRGRYWRRLCRAPGEMSREGDEGEWSQKETVSGHGVSGSRLISGVAHPRPEHPVREPAHPKLGYPARGPAHPSPRKGRGRKEL